MSMAAPADTERMEIETEGYQTLVSFYTYGLVALAVLTLISPMIVLSVPLVVVLGPPGLAWWRGRNKVRRVGPFMLRWLIVASVMVFLTPLIPGIWLLADNDSGPPPESFWLIVTALLLAPFPLSAVMYRHRMLVRSTGTT